MKPALRDRLIQIAGALHGLSTELLVWEKRIATLEVNLEAAEDKHSELREKQTALENELSNLLGERGLTMTERAINFLRGRPDDVYHTSGIAHAIGAANGKSLNTMLARLASAGTIRRVRRGYYAAKVPE